MADDEAHSNFDPDRSTASEMQQFKLEAHGRVTGWRVSKNWYLGHERGSDSGVSFIWQRDANEMSISKEGIRFTRRF